MLFLQKMESDAVDKLLLLIPAFYGMTLGILFFLIYFACKYQFERRRHELGVYLMLGMRRSKLFGMLLAEDCLTSILAMLIGLPVAVVLSEICLLYTSDILLTAHDLHGGFIGIGIKLFCKFIAAVIVEVSRVHIKDQLTVFDGIRFQTDRKSVV